MADANQNAQSFQGSDERIKYIGFGVYPGKAGDIFATPVGNRNPSSHRHMSNTENRKINVAYLNSLMRIC